MFDIGLEKYYANFESVAWDTVIFLKNLWQTSRQPYGSVEIFVEKGISHDFQGVEENGAFSNNLGYSETVCLYVTIATLCRLQCNQNRLSIEATSTTTTKKNISSARKQWEVNRWHCKSEDITWRPNPSSIHVSMINMRFWQLQFSLKNVILSLF